MVSPLRLARSALKAAEDAYDAEQEPEVVLSLLLDVVGYILAHLEAKAREEEK